jgi:hypothetical protein
MTNEPNQTATPALALTKRGFIESVSELNQHVLNMEADLRTIAATVVESRSCDTMELLSKMAFIDESLRLARRALMGCAITLMTRISEESCEQ